MEKLFIRFTEPRVPLTRDGYEFTGIIYYKVPTYNLEGEIVPEHYARRTLFGIQLRLNEDFDLKELPKVMAAFTQDVKDAAIKMIQGAEVEK